MGIGLRERRGRRWRGRKGRREGREGKGMGCHGPEQVCE